MPWVNTMRLACAALLLASAPIQALAQTGAGHGDRWAITGVTVIPLDTDQVLADQTVLLRDGRIERIAPAARLRVPKDFTRIDGRGKYLLPGFVDAHAHLSNAGALRASSDANLAALPLGEGDDYDRLVLLGYLRAGVTGVANLGGSAASDEHLLALRDAIAAGRVAGPRLYVAKRINGPRAAVATKPEQPVPPSRIDAPTTAADGIAAVRQAKTRGYDLIKPYQFLNRETYRAVVEESHRQGFVTSGHLPELGCADCADRAFAFAHPMDNIAHSEELARYGRQTDFAPADIDALADLVSRRGIAVTPTLITLKTIVQMYVQRTVPPLPPEWDARVDPVTRHDWQAPRNRYLSEAFRQQDGAAQFSAGYDFARMLTRELWKRGVPLTVGTDSALPGLAFGHGVQQEMIELREIGLSPLDVLRAASLNAHRLLDPQAGSGAVREGQAANLVLLDADPLADIQHIDEVAGIFAQGRWLSSARMEDEYARLAPLRTRLQEHLDGPADAH
ncbi:amidohydrolase family protein [Pseudoxanthomonas putridarboris]|uniref:Amidohydrolase family protein n=1 Tax=Pseudoxanthomonas putridarboris TaxID=752605 RepID=A0ABU9J1M1_9GAMM